MPRITISRVIGLVPMTWLCLVATWFFLPSPVVSPDARNNYIQHHLQRGSTVTTIIEYSESIKFTDPWGKSRNDEKYSGRRSCQDCEGLILDWRLESHRQSDSLMLHLGEARVNLTEAALRGPSPEKPAEERKSYLSDSFRARLLAGGKDVVLTLPWSKWTEMVLTDNTLYRYRENVDFRIFSPEPGLIEVWKDIDMWQTYKPGDVIRDTEREAGLVASFSHVPASEYSGAQGSRTKTENIAITKIPGQLPPRTWPIRWLIAGPLYFPLFMPTAIIYNLTFEFVPMPLILFFQMSCVLAILMRFERISILPRQWLCKERTKRNKHRGIWGAAGPISDEESGLLAVQPQKPMAMFPHAISKPSRSRAPVFDKI